MAKRTANYGKTFQREQPFLELFRKSFKNAELLCKWNEPSMGILKIVRAKATYQFFKLELNRISMFRNGSMKIEMYVLLILLKVHITRRKNS